MTDRHTAIEYAMSLKTWPISFRRRTDHLVRVQADLDIHSKASLLDLFQPPKLPKAPKGVWALIATLRKSD